MRRSRPSSDGGGGGGGGGTRDRSFSGEKRRKTTTAAEEPLRTSHGRRHRSRSRSRSRSRDRGDRDRDRDRDRGERYNNSKDYHHQQQQQRSYGGGRNSYNNNQHNRHQPNNNNSNNRGRAGHHNNGRHHNDRNMGGGNYSGSSSRTPPVRKFGSSPSRQVHSSSPRRNTNDHYQCKVPVRSRERSPSRGKLPVSGASSSSREKLPVSEGSSSREKVPVSEGSSSREKEKVPISGPSCSREKLPLCDQRRDGDRNSRMDVSSSSSNSEIARVSPSNVTGKFGSSSSKLHSSSRRNNHVADHYRSKLPVRSARDNMPFSAQRRDRNNKLNVSSSHLNSGISRATTPIGKFGNSSSKLHSSSPRRNNHVVGQYQSKLPVSGIRNARGKLPLSGTRSLRGKFPVSGARSARDKLPVAARRRDGNSKLNVQSSPNSGLARPDRTRGTHSSSVSIPSTSTSTSAKMTLEELHSLNDNADDYQELPQVEKWVRSAPDELYYDRQMDGLALATERTKRLCDKFESTLLVTSKTARIEAEELGAAKMKELIEMENRSEKCNHAIVEKASPPTPEENNKVATLENKTENDSMEEGELPDSSDGEEQQQHNSKDDSKKNSKTNSKKTIEPASETQVKTDATAVSATCPDAKPISTETSEAKKEKSLPKEAPKTKHKVLKKKRSRSCKKCSSDSESKDSANNGNEGDKSSSSSSDEDDSGSSSSSSESEDGFSMTRSDTANRELERRKKHPRRLHTELWHNDPGLMNDGPVCRCSAKARRFGIRHGFYPGEEKIEHCDHFSNNKSKLYHYRITISPPKNFLISTPTVINHDGHEYIFEGFSIFSHYKLDLTLPPCKVIRFNIRYDVFVEEERFPESFCVKELLLFETYLFREILELVDIKYDWTEETGCSQFHLMPRFVRQLPDNGQEILSMIRVLIHLLKSDKEVVKEEDLSKLYTVEQSEWQNFADKHKGTIVTKWGMKPCAIRVDQIDRDVSGREIVEEDGIPFPLIVHFGIRPPQLSYAGNAGYQRAWRRYVKYRHLLSNMPKPSQEDKLKLLRKEMKLQAMRTASNMKRDVTVAISSKGFRSTGICCDLVQHAMLIPVLVAHLRFHKCLQTLEKTMIYEFSNRYLLQLAMTHPSYRENFGTNPDHARNALTNCGIRQPEYGDRRIHYASTRKRGINTLINIMAKFGADQETESDITHNERLEFLGDAVVEFVTSIHLFHIFPDLEEGGLATYRAAIVQNQHLAVLAQTLGLDQYMLYAHGSDLCHDSELRHAMANCFEALMGALFLDGGIEAADRVFGNTLFGNDDRLLNLWINYPKHPLQQEEPNGDREWIKDYDVLKKLTEFENSIGVEFSHIRLLARAFTDRSLGYNNLTRGSNQRLEFLGDTVLQLISSEYLYRHFPDHHEGHLSLLRSSLVNNRTQSVVCDDLGMFLYAMRGDPKSEMKTKDRADLLEAFLGALYIDKGLTFCIRFCQVCFFPRLSKSITKQEWNDPKSKLQQCCLTLRAMDGREPDIPVYKVTESLGPTNTRTYIVAVYFRGKRLATAQGHSIQEAEMNAAALALEISGHLFPQLHHQRRIMDKTKKV